MHPSLFATFSMDLVTISVLFVLLKSKCILEMFKYVLLGNIMPCADHRVGLQIRDVYNFWTSHLCRNLCSCQVPDRRHGWKMLIHITGLQQILPLPCLFLHHPPSCISHRVGYTVPLIWTISHIQPLPTGYTSVFWNRGQEAQINLSKFNSMKSTSSRYISSCLGLSTFFLSFTREKHWRMNKNMYTLVD